MKTKTNVARKSTKTARKASKASARKAVKGKTVARKERVVIDQNGKIKVLTKEITTRREGSRFYRAFQQMVKANGKTVEAFKKAFRPVKSEDAMQCLRLAVADKVIRIG